MHVAEPCDGAATALSELQVLVSPHWVNAAILACGVLLFMATEGLSDPVGRGNAQLLVLFLHAAAVAGWLLHGWHPLVGRWFTVVVLAILIPLAGEWAGVDGLGALFVVPVAVAAGMVGLFGAALVALGVTLVLLGPARAVAGATTPAALAADLIAIWAVLGVMWAAHRPLRHLVLWAWRYSEQARVLLESDRDRKAELQQALAGLAQANRQLALANEKTAALRLAAEEAHKSKGEFVARVSHEFRTPLNMIIGLVDLMVESPEIYAEDFQPDLRRDLEIVHRNCQHLCSMVNDVLDLSQAEAAHLTLQREGADLGEIIDSALTAVRPLLEKKGLTLRAEIPEGLPLIYCDRTRIRQVLLNLASNAARFTDKGGIAVHVTLDEQHVVVGVTDSGSGISREDAERVFEPFYRAPGSLWRERGGSGLGLAISKQCVELHGGRIWLESEPGAGATFYFQLPVSPPAEHIAGPVQWLREDWVWHETAFRGAQVASGQLSKPRVVICDATGSLYPALARYLEEAELIDTRDLVQAAHELHRCPACALLLNTEGLGDPWPLVEKASRESPGTTVIGCAVSPPVPRALAAGALAHLTKPVTRQALEGAMRAVGRSVARVLLVDDDPEVLQLLARMLAVYDSKIEVTTAATGRDALEKLRLVGADLVLLDIMLPELDGWQVLAAIQQDEALRQIPILLVSAQDPGVQPLASPYLLAAIGEGLSVHKLLRGSLRVSALLSKPD